MVGGIPIDDNRGKEIVSRFSTDIYSKGEFYTDSNGREMLRRIRNQRPTWNLTLAEPVAGNYYPVTAKIAVEDVDLRFAVLNDRAQGGSSLVDGAVDLMVKPIMYEGRIVFTFGFAFRSTGVCCTMMLSALAKHLTRPHLVKDSLHEVTTT